jgi:hypothetical protein
MIRVFCEAIRAENERALVGERMASLMKGGGGFKGNQHTGGNSPRGPLPDKPAVTMARAAESEEILETLRAVTI